MKNKKQAVVIGVIVIAAILALAGLLRPKTGSGSSETAAAQESPAGTQAPETAEAAESKVPETEAPETEAAAEDEAAASATLMVRPVTAEGPRFSGSGESISMELVFDPAWFTDGDAAVYDARIAKLCALLSADSYFRQKDLDKGTQSRVTVDDVNAVYSETLLLEQLGFSDVVRIDSYKEGKYTEDTNDSLTMLLGHMTVSSGEDLYAAVLRGNYSVGEWDSTFDLGSETPAYEELTGTHDEWQDRSALKGMDVAAVRVGDYLRDYRETCGDPASEDIILLTGHSRGASLAGLLGAELERSGEAKTFTYTFSTPVYTTDPEAAQLSTIFNIYDTDDFFTDLFPFGEETLTRYGTDITVSVRESEETQAAITSLKGGGAYSCMDPEARAEYRKIFSERFPDRASLYEPCSLTQRFDSEEEAQQALETCQAIVGAEAGLDLGTYCTLSEVTEHDGKYEFTLDYCGGGLMKCLGRTLAYGKSVSDVMPALFTEEEPAVRLMQICAEQSAGISFPHALIVPYVISDRVQ